MAIGKLDIGVDVVDLSTTKRKLGLCVWSSHMTVCVSV